MSDTLARETHRNWCFTLNNPISAELAWGRLAKVRYAIWQLEKGESKQTPHLQGYIELTQPAKMGYFRNVIPGAHLESRRGTRDQARDYCRKQESRIQGPWEYGNWEVGGQGKRTDLDHLKDLIDSGKTEKEICKTDFALWAKNFKIIERYILLTCPQREWRTKCVLVTGDPGTSKSTYCRRMVNEDPYYKDDTIWWPGYDGQEAVVFDEFEGALDITMINRICDAFPLVVQVKGGGVAFTAKKIYINSNSEPKDWWPKVSPAKLQSFNRRVDEWLIFKNIDLRFIEIIHIIYDVNSPNHPEISRFVDRFDISQGWEEMNQRFYAARKEVNNLKKDTPVSSPPTTVEGGEETVAPTATTPISSKTSKKIRKNSKSKEEKEFKRDEIKELEDL